MEQLYNAMLASIQTLQPAPAAQKGDASQKDGFQKLLEQKQSADTKTAPKQEKTDAPRDSKPAQGGEKTQGTDQPQEAQAVQEDPKELEKQIALAAMAVLQNPVVPVERTVMTPEVQAEAFVDEIAPMAAEAALTPEEQSFAPETEEAVELPVEGGETQAADQAPVEELPQTIEAPETAQETEGRTVEVKAETVDRTEDAADTAEDVPELQDAEAEALVFEDVKAIPVKVGEAPKAKEAAETENIGRQVGEKLIQITSVSAESGGQKITIDLDPAYLGKLHVEVGLTENGTLYVHVDAENSHTQNLLSRNSDNLANILGKYAEQEVHVEVPRQEESQRQDLYEQQQQHHQQRRQEERRRQETGSEDFLQQLRLGLIPLDGE